MSYDHRITGLPEVLIVRLPDGPERVVPVYTQQVGGLFNSEPDPLLCIELKSGVLRYGHEIVVSADSFY
jgi:hypothetical protein